jgi:transposase InsO family protein
VHHSDAGSQYTSVRHATLLLDAGAPASIGSVGDSYDNAPAESVIGRVYRHIDPQQQQPPGELSLR